jgi:hypothetical protein
MVNCTVDHFGHFIQLTTSFTQFSGVISFPSTAITLSHHLSPAFSAGDPTIGDIIMSSHGVVISI